MYPRKLAPVVEALLAEFRIVYLTGPRQAGKTTLARAIAERMGMGYITLDNPAALASAQNDPRGFVQSLGERRVVLDEFQYAPGLIPAVKETSDRLPRAEQGKFLLTGSADIFRSAKTQEALPGHMARLELLPLSLSELTQAPLNIIDYILAADFQHAQAKAPGRPIGRQELAAKILRGGYPEPQNKSPGAKRVWFKSYTEGRLFKDFESLYAARGDYHSKLKAMMPCLAGLSGNLLKYSSIANDLALNDKLVKSYIEILDLMFIVKRMPAYLHNRAKRLAVHMPKMHYVDTGLACHLLGLRREEQLLNSSYYGGLLENLIYMECYKQVAWAKEEVTLYHFRDNRQYEVDIVLERDNGEITGIEVKASASVNIQDFRGLARLAAFAGPLFAGGILFYAGEDILPFNVAGQRFYALPMGLITMDNGGNIRQEFGPWLSGG